MGLFTDLCVAGLGLCDVGSYTVKNVLLTLFFELLRVPLTFRDPIMSVNESNYLFHASTRAALDEVFGQAFERSGYSKTTVDLPGVKAKVLAYAGMDAHGERRVAVVNVICEISQPHTMASGAVMFSNFHAPLLRLNGCSWKLGLRLRHPVGDHPLYELRVCKERPGCNTRNYTTKFSNEVILKSTWKFATGQQVSGIPLETLTSDKWWSHCVWTLADVLPDQIAGLFDCRTCGFNIGATDICAACQEMTHTTPCDTCSTLVGFRFGKRRCIAHEDWVDHFTEESDEE